MMNLNRKVFRFDDVSINTLMPRCNSLAEILHSKFPTADIIYAISPIVFEVEGNEVEMQRVFPKIFNAYSDYRNFFKAEKIGMPENIPSFVKLANHGLFHVDSRLLTKEQQEMNILAGCSLTKSYTFAPPFSKYNQDTIDICNEHHIVLHRFEQSWKCLEHEVWDIKTDKWYLHPRLWTKEKLTEYLNKT